jgi:hypothetical protein
MHSALLFDFSSRRGDCHGTGGAFAKFSFNEPLTMKAIR